MPTLKKPSRVVKSSLPTRTPTVTSLHRRYVGSDPARQADYADAVRDIALGEKLFQAREAAGLTQAALARKIGTQPSAISRLEDADYDGHSMDTLRRVADALGLMLIVDFVNKPAPTKPRRLVK